MSTKRDFVYRKDLLELGYKNTHIATIINQASIFADIPKAKGYAIQLDYRQALLIIIGCELFKVGIAFRYIDFVLATLSQVDIKKRVAKGNSILVVFPVTPAVEKELAEEGRDHPIPTKYAGGIGADVTLPVRFTPINIYYEKRDFLVNVFKSLRYASCVCVDLEAVVAKIDGVFSSEV